MIYLFLQQRIEGETTLAALNRMAAQLAIITKKKRHPVRKREDGKPIWEGGFVSCSHSGDHLAAAFSSAPVGVDLERETERDFKSLSLRFCGEILEKEAFYRRWTAAECAFKAYGVPVLEGLKKPPNGVRQCKAPDGYCLSVMGTGRIVPLSLCDRGA